MERKKFSCILQKFKERVKESNPKHHIKNMKNSDENIKTLNLKKYKNFG